MDGATIRQTGNAAVLNATGTWTAAQTVTAISNTEHLFPNAASTALSTAVTVADASGYSIGDKVKVISSDALSPDGGSARMGQAALVGDVVGNVIYLHSALENVAGYVTAVQIAKAPNLELTFVGGKWTSTPGQSWTSNHIILNGVSRLVMDRCVGYGGYQKWLWLQGVTDFHIKDCEAWNFPDDGVRFGYGIALEASERGVVHGFTGGGVRHLFTTAVAPSATSFARQGAVRDVVVSDGVGVGCKSSAWDTHPATRDVTFNNCYVAGGTGGNSANGLGYSLRGQRITVNNPVVRGCRRGIHVYSASNSQTRHIAINNPDIRGGDGPCLVVDNTGSTDAIETEVGGGYMQTSHTSIVDLNADVDLTIKGSTLVGTGGASTLKMFRGTGTAWYFRALGCVLDFRLAPSAVVVDGTSTGTGGRLINSMILGQCGAIVTGSVDTKIVAKATDAALAPTSTPTAATETYI